MFWSREAKSVKADITALASNPDLDYFYEIVAPRYCRNQIKTFFKKYLV